MNFIDFGKKGDEKIGSYVLTIICVFSAFILGQFIMVILAKDMPGISITEPGQSADLNSLLVLILIPFIFVFLSLLLSVRYIHRRSVLSVFTARESFDWKRFFTAFFIWGGILAVFHAAFMLSGSPIEWNFDPKTFFVLVLIAAFLLPLQTAAEELFFRGYMMQAFRKIIPPGIGSVIITGVLFGLLHLGNPEIERLGYGLLIYYIMSGIFLGLLTHLDDGMELGLGYHTANNIFGAVIVTNEWQAFQTNALYIDHSEPVFGWESILTIALIQPGLILIFGKMYKWKDWKSKMIK